LTTSSVDLGDVPVVDNHVHPLTHAQPRDAESFRRAFSEAHGDEIPRDHLGTSVNYRWSVSQIAGHLGVAAAEEVILARRGALDFEEYARDLLQTARIAYLLLDTGFPPPSQAYSPAEMERMLGIRCRPILRLETLLQDLIVRHETLNGVAHAFDTAVSEAPSNGYVGLKSIAAYRTGLAIEHVSEDDAETAFGPVREEAVRNGTLRLTSKPLLDYFVLRALRWAATQHMPVQFHTGYGDPDLDLRLANPLHLRAVLEDRDLAGAPIVLLHESFPYTSEAAYLATVYPHVYLDIAFTLPPLDRLLLRRSVETALGTAPASKVMVSSDGVGIPEQYWLGAVRARAIVAEVLVEMVDAGEIDAEEGSALGRQVLHGTASQVYGLDY
jgi:predicted TIM-barrel fold metal-dependent hydrolase